MAAVTGILGSIDFFRTEPERDVRDGLKEWQHFVVHGSDSRVIINYSLSRSELPTERHVGRVVVLVHHHTWSGVVADVSVDAIVVERGRLTRAEFGDSVLAFENGSYLVQLHLPEHRVSARLRFVPDSTPFAKNNQPLASGRMSWLFVPRLLADGHLQLGPDRFAMRRAAAYHDHNWGRFRWGEDFGWQWGTVLPTDEHDPWSIVFMRMTDRTQSQVRSQCLYVWHDGRPLAMFRDGALDVQLVGLLRTPPRLTLPGALALVAPGSASDIPAEAILTARRGDDRVDLRLRPHEYARIAIPSETGPAEVVALHEVSAHVVATGTIAGRPLETEGSSVVEFLR